MSNARTPPRGWGDDPLTEFLESAYRNRWATFANKKAFNDLLIRIDHCFLSVLTDWRDPAEPIAALLFYRSHAMYRAACEHAFAGQVTETFPLIRLALEFAGYALRIAKNKELAETWLRRHDDAEAMGAVIKAITAKKIRSTIETGDAKTAEVFDGLYQRAIDFGAHPNERAVTSSLSIIKGEGRTDFKQAYLSGDGLSLDHVLKSVAQAGVCIINVMFLAYPERFGEIGMAEEPFRLREGL